MLLKPSNKMRSFNYLLKFVVLALFVAGCSDDDNEATAPEPARPLGEVLVEDEVKIREYLETHYYNYEEFQNPRADFDFKIDIKEIPEGDTTGLIPLIDSIQTIEVQVPSSHFLIEGEETTVAHTLYYLSIREGRGEGLSVADSSFIQYEGSLLDGTIIDQNNVNRPVWFDLAILQAPAASPVGGTAARGFSEGVSLFREGDGLTVNDDGTFTVENYGIGLIIFPSGLGYYNRVRSTIPAYSPLVFKIDLFVKEQTDHDGDGIISIEEDTNNNGYLFDDDSDGDGIPDYLDAES